MNYPKIRRTILSLPSSLFHSINIKKTSPLDGTGILHAMRLYRNHPELDMVLEQVEHPTDENLFDAGMVHIRLVRRGLGGKKSGESS
jgi:hypothetical protein